MNEKLIKDFINRLQIKIDKYNAYYYGYLDIADGIIAALIRGTKKATTGLLGCYEEDNEPLPKVGDISIILNSKEEPKAITKGKEVLITPFKDIDEKYAFIEAEDDLSLKYWKMFIITFLKRNVMKWELNLTKIWIVFVKYSMLFILKINK